MSDAAGFEKTLTNLIELSRVDAAIVRIQVEKKRTLQELATRKTALQKNSSERQVFQKTLDEKKARYAREEKSLKEERDKLIARRKTLATLGNYKLQQAAEREIEHASRQLTVREESTLAWLDEIDKLEKQVVSLQSVFDEQSVALQQLEKESEEVFSRLEDQESERSKERANIVSQLRSADLGMYERVRERYPGDAVLAIQSGACSGCFMQVAPQLLVQITRGDSLVRCRGCGRILYIPNEDTQEQKKAS